MNLYYNFIKKYKILHLVFWLWSFFELLHQRTEKFGSIPDNLPDVIITILSQMAAVYFTIYILVPKFLNRDKQLLFAVYSIGTIIIAAFLSTILLDVYLFLVEGLLIANFFFLTFVEAVSIAAKTVVFVAIVIISDRYRSSQLKKKLEKEKLEAELSFLKSQINPHFLFNALNCIYVLIKIDKDIATNTLLQFSDLLRYQLYECSENKVDVGREFNFLTDFINLEKIRKPENLTVTAELDAATSFKIAPFLLIPFVENAFKHVSRDNSQQNFIAIKGLSDKGCLTLSVSNSYNKNDTGKKNGIGLQNVIRRLELLYPLKHSLDIFHNDGIYTVNLAIYEEDELYYS